MINGIVNAGKGVFTPYKLVVFALPRVGDDITVLMLLSLKVNYYGVA